MTSDFEIGSADVFSRENENEIPERIPECETADDLYTPPARDAVARFCQRLLDEQILIPSELLHSSRHQQTVSNLPTFVSVLRQADRALHRKESIDVLVNEVARKTRERLKPVSLPDLIPEQAGPILTRLLSQAPNGRFLAEAAITQNLQSCRTFAAKASSLCALARNMSEKEPYVLIDRFLGEIARSEAGVVSLGGDAPFTELADALVSLLAADRKLDANVVPSIFVEFEELLATKTMPSLKDGLCVAFARLLRRENRFAIASAGDLFGIETVQRELMELSRLATRLQTDDGFIGGAPIE